MRRDWIRWQQSCVRYIPEKLRRKEMTTESVSVSKDGGEKITNAILDQYDKLFNKTSLIADVYQLGRVRFRLTRCCSNAKPETCSHGLVLIK